MAKRLTPTMKKEIASVAQKGVKFFTGKPLPKDVLDTFYETLQKHMDAEKPVLGKEAVALWAAKMNFAIANGDKKSVGKLITFSDMAKARPGGVAELAFWDSNGGCSCGAGGGGAGSW